ncbi:MAG: potassium transporter Kup [Ardenticatenales bacterium]
MSAHPTTTAPAAHSPDTATTHGHGPIGPLALAALGVVFGDIGTSPLYAIRECFHGPHAIAITHGNVFGVLSLIIWSLIIVISIKYIVFILRADNHGEGGILALTALISPQRRRTPTARTRLILLGLFGAALLYGDGVITPAISVLSAVEGLRIITPTVEPFLLPITIGILIGLFAFQRRGTASVGAVFGPVMLVWFAAIAVLGLRAVIGQPSVLAAVNPYFALRFMVANGYHGFVILGTVFLVVTGGEALYADMGHFGRRPIALGWFALVLPCLLLNYFGQSALLLVRPEAAAEHPFFQLAPDWAVVPLVILATCATVIASQALISGAFSLTMQAIQLGYCPRLDIRHTSADARGQIYIGAINWTLAAACVLVVLGFRSSSNLAAAYGIAVTSTMAITTALFYVVLRERWGWSRLRAGVLCSLFLTVDVAFLGANALKLFAGGWFPLLLAALVFTVMTTWHTGRRLLSLRLTASSKPMKGFLEKIDHSAITRVPGMSVFLYSNPHGTPPALIQNVRHNRVRHEHIVVVTVLTADVPSIEPSDRPSIERLGDTDWRVQLSFGFMEQPNVPKALAEIQSPGWAFEPGSATYFLSRERVIPSSRPGMAHWREVLFAWLSANALRATYYFGLPPTQVVEFGSQLPI